MKHFAIAVMLFCAVIATAQEQDPLSFQIDAGYQLPLGESASYFAAGPTARFTTEYNPPPVPWLGLGAALGYDYTAISSSAQSAIHSVWAQGLLSFTFSPVPWFGVKASTGAGYYFPIVTDTAVPRIGNMLVSAGLSAFFRPIPILEIGILGGYKKYFDFQDAVEICVTATVRPSRVRPLEIHEIRLDPVFPVLFKHYEGVPIGEAVIENKGTTPIEGIRVSLFVEQYMDNPKQCRAPEYLRAGQSAPIELFSLFSDKILEITEDTVVSAKIVMEYRIAGKEQSRSVSQSLRIYNRNAITWGDDRKAAAYVTTRDPQILQFSKNIVGWARASTSPALNQNLVTAMGIHEALRLYGMTYVTDPRTPFIKYSKDSKAVDFLQFPIQTLAYKAGDCDDLSILYSALLESVGISSAFITTPGHIFIAFSLGIPEREARMAFLKPDDLIFRGDDAWIPVEITLVKKGFLEAWSTGAAEWRRSNSEGTARFYSMSESWREYETVGFLKSDTPASLPGRDEFMKALSREVGEFVTRETAPRVLELNQQKLQGRERAKALNQLGVLYARYGSLDEAKKQFGMAVAREEYIPALCNLGNLLFMASDFPGALGYYKRAYAASPDAPEVIYQMARACYEMRDLTQANRWYSELKRMRPDLAQKLSYLDPASSTEQRAGRISVMEEIQWLEE